MIDQNKSVSHEQLKKQLLIISGFSGSIAILLGALGAHALKSVLTPTQLKSFETGNEYHIYHTLAILILCALIDFLGSKSARKIAMFFLFGIVFFSGSIYLLSLKDVLNITFLQPFLGPITPIGGLLFVIGWSMLVVQAYKMKANE